MSADRFSPKFHSPARLGALAALAIASLAGSAHALIVSGATPMPAPANGFIGNWNGSTAVCVGPRWIISARHVGGAPGTKFTRPDGQEWTAIEVRNHPDYDVQLVHVDRDLPGWHKFAENPQLGEPVLLGGYGQTTNGPMPNNRGWTWGGPRALIWGANKIDGEGLLLAVRFDRPTDPNSVPFESTFAVNDSGAGLFTIGADGSLELAGIAISVSEWGQSSWGSMSFALNANLYRNWAMPIVDPSTPITSGIIAPQASVALPGVHPVLGGLALIAMLGSIRRRRIA